jgi:hypothetical protein
VEDVHQRVAAGVQRTDGDFGLAAGVDDDELDAEIGALDAGRG